MKSRLSDRVQCDRQRVSHFLKLALAAFLGSGLLASCSAGPEAQGQQPAAQTTASGDFTFPQATCGDEATSALNQNWYPVFIDGADLDEIRSKYCGDAVNAVRAKSGNPSVQVATFANYERAQQFAQAVGGEVEAVGATASPSPGATSATRPTHARSGVLAPDSEGQPINIRASASTTAAVQETGYGGDRVKILEKTEAGDNSTWYKVELESGATGWVRSDLIAERPDTENINTDSVNSDTENTGTLAEASPDSASPSSTAADTTTTASPSPSATTSTSESETDTASPSATASPESETDAPSPAATASPTDSPLETANTETPASETSSDATSSATERTEAEQTAILTAQEPESAINVRQEASTSAAVQEVAYVGDAVQIEDTRQGEDGQTWYKVQFESGVTGWVRGDFIDSPR
jgi:uncharacterized protein YgiM (DUF1202 family)